MKKKVYIRMTASRKFESAYKLLSKKQFAYIVQIIIFRSEMLEFEFTNIPREQTGEKRTLLLKLVENIGEFW